MDSSEDFTIKEQKHPYLQVFGILAVLTVLEVVVGIAEIDDIIQVPILAFLALGKAYLVAAFFLGVKYESYPYLVASIVFVLPLFIALPLGIIPILS
ncbi:MAG: cytochrome C oxidase subunit IV family protein [Candidatus Hodarchaeota archaeon]